MDSTHALPRNSTPDVSETKSRVLVFAGEVEAEAIGNFMREFTELDATTGPIEIRIYSGGGDSYGAMAIYDLIRSSPNEVHTVAFGDVSSAAVLIFQAGDQRIASQNCTFLLHPTSTHVEGTFVQVETASKETQRIHRRYCQLLAERSGMALKKVMKLCSKETFVTADEAVALGLADHKLGARAISPT